MSNESNNNWLGFSLSGPSMEGSSTDHHPCSNSVANTVPLSFSSPFSYPGIYYGVEGENSGFYSNLTMMPIRSDGSLCLMEAINRSQVHPQVMLNSTPKLEDFFGGAAMGSHHNFEICNRGIDLSLDSVYTYQQNPENQEYPNYPSFRGQEMYQETEPIKEDSSSLQLPTMGNDEMKNWVSRNYQNGLALEQNGSIGCDNLKCLSLSMSPGSQSSYVTSSQQVTTPVMAECNMGLENKKRASEKVEQKKQIVHRKSIDTFGQRTSQYRGVTRHRWTGRYEAHLWDNSCKKEGQSRKGRQVYLGGYDLEDKAARSYDLAALKYWGPSTHINFPLENYEQELEGMKNMSRQEYVAHLRRKSSGFSRGASIYRGVTRHHQHGRWQARIGRVAGNKDLYLGTFSTQEEAAEAYDVAAIKFRGVNAVTNFEASRYDVELIMESTSLLSGEMARRNKDANSFRGNSLTNHDMYVHSSVAKESNSDVSDWGMALYQATYHKRVPEDSKVANFLGPLNGPGPMGSSQDGHGEMATHMSNASSLVTSLSGSREDSPDKNNVLATEFGVSQMGSKVYQGAAGAVSPWIRSGQIRAQVPLFSAWTDAS